jgi:UDP-N-acetylglucosamine 2-epimerase (non-hydrolysing)
VVSTMEQPKNSRPVVAVVVGTRPEAIKLVPVLRELRRHRDLLQTVVISTGQHREMLDQVIVPFNISVDYDMSLMEPRQSLYKLSSKAILAFEDVLMRFRPNLLLVQGDTTTAFIGALAAHYAKVPVGHVEAGLRTNNKHFPFPEEINRRLISVTTELHFAPTNGNRQNLLREGVPADKIFVTGNTAIDTLLAALELKRDSAHELPALDGKRLVLVTVHRREVFGEAVREIFYALRDLADAVSDVLVVFPVHLNPNVRKPAEEILGSSANIVLMEPLDYFGFVHAMSHAHLILTDSGGIQEEAPTLGVRVLVLRNQTERPEGLETGMIQLVGTDRRAILEHALRALCAGATAKHDNQPSPYGDGRASARIVKEILRFLRLPNRDIYNEIGEFRPDLRLETADSR